VCCEVLSTKSITPSKLIRHLETKHSALKHTPVEFFQRKLKTLNDEQTSKVTRVIKMRPRLKLHTECLSELQKCANRILRKV
jgi:hypothetical protein